MLVFNIQHFSIHDGNGIRTVIFLKGCPLDCAWCHNPEGKSMKPEISFDISRCIGCQKCLVCQNGAHSFEKGIHALDRLKCSACGECAKICPTESVELIGKEYSVEQIISEVKKDSIFYGSDGGVTISGGEPFARYDELIELLVALKTEKINIALETSGFTSPERIKKVAEYVDMFLYDCKHTEDAAHIEYIGVERKKILENLDVLDELGANVRLRCPIIPNVNDTNAHIDAVAELAERHTSISSVELEPYHPLGIRKYSLIGQSARYTFESKLAPERLNELLERLKSKTQKPAFAG